MYEAEDHAFFDELYQQWTKTTGAEDTYWVVEEDTEHYAGGPGTWNVWAVPAAPSKDIDAVDGKKFIASFEREEDADFTAGLNGAIPDLIRRLHEAIDEAVRKDEANDIAQGQLADALLENIGLRGEIHELEVANAEQRERLEDEENR
ncbi:hypothetical protein SEA_CHANGELING_40 [Mycobacterium phage Changeling]|nr:hypothetical protein SEA_CHANGELING_40 [Mycobacterium phage Changeling]